MIKIVVRFFRKNLYGHRLLVIIFANTLGSKNSWFSMVILFLRVFEVYEMYQWLDSLSSSYRRRCVPSAAITITI